MPGNALEAEQQRTKRPFANMPHAASGERVAVIDQECLRVFEVGLYVKRFCMTLPPDNIGCVG